LRLSCVVVAPGVLAPQAPAQVACQPVWQASFGQALGVEGEVDALEVYDDGTGRALYVGGDFATAGGVAANDIAKWDGASWSALGSGMSGGFFSTSVFALTVFDDGSGPALYAGGAFNTAGGVGANSIAKWNGTTWSALGSGLDSSVRALVKFDDGSQPAPYAGGEFTSAGSVPANHIATWGCSAWTNLGFALPGTMGTPLLVGIGDLTAGSPASLVLQSAAPSTLAHLFVADQSTPTAFKCGTLVPGSTQFHKHIVLVTSPSGDLHLDWPAFPASLSGLSLYFQYVIPDAAAVCGAALSNALRADVP
jgi:hypothetical protein